MPVSLKLDQTVQTTASQRFLPTIPENEKCSRLSLTAFSFKYDFSILSSPQASKKWCINMNNKKISKLCQQNKRNMEMINHCTSEGKPMTSSQVFNRATNRAICFRASKGTWAHLKKLALGWGRNPLFPYGHPTSSTSTSGTSHGWSRMKQQMDPREQRCDYSCWQQR